MPKCKYIFKQNDQSAEEDLSHLTEPQVLQLLAAARKNRNGVRDHLLLLMMFQHGLRVSEAITLRQDDINLTRAHLWVERLKGGLSTEQPIDKAEMRAIRRWLAIRGNESPFLFTSERKQPLTRQSVNYIIATAAKRADLCRVTPHMLRHSCGYALAKRGLDLKLIQNYLGHREPKYATLYASGARTPFDALSSASEALALA